MFLQLGAIRAVDYDSSILQQPLFKVQLTEPQ